MQMGYDAALVKCVARATSNSCGAPVGAGVVNRFDVTIGIAHQRAGMADILVI